MSLSKKQKIYLTGSSLVAIFCLITWLAIFSVIGQLQKSSQTLAQAKRTNETFYRDWRNLENFKKDYAEIQQELATQPVLLQPSEALKFIEYIEKAAQLTNNLEKITILELKPPQQSESAEKTLNFQISLWGKFPDLIKFLIYLENAPYYNDISSIQINRLSQKTTSVSEEETLSETGDIQTVINLAVYQL